MLLFLLGCVENGLQGPSAAPPFAESGDSSPEPVDSGDSSPEPFVDSSTSCPDTVPADDAEPITADCLGTVTPFTGEFVELWRTPASDFVTALHAAHMEDGNGDGVIDSADPCRSS